MLIYEVSATVESALASEFERYMADRHIPDVLATGFFSAAFFANNGDKYRIGYHCETQQNLEAYLANDAESLRADFLKHFPEGIELSRQNLEIIALFPGS